MSSKGNISREESLEQPVAGGSRASPSQSTTDKFRNPFSKTKPVQKSVKRTLFHKWSYRTYRRCLKYDHDCDKYSDDCKYDEVSFCRVDYDIESRNVQHKPVSPKNVFDTDVQKIVDPKIVQPKPVSLENVFDTDVHQKIAINICSCGKPNCIGCFPICKSCGSQKCGDKCLNSSNSMYRIDYI